jgi:hypothetical protein
VDCLLRALDRSTTPPGAGTEGLFAIHWLGNLAAHVRRPAGCTGLSWPQAAALHPALQMLEDAGEWRWGEESLVPAAIALSRACGWAQVRRQCIEREWLPDLISPALAAWMDTGMLSRWVLGGARSVPELLDQLHGMLTPAVTRRVRQSLQELGVGTESTDAYVVAARKNAAQPVNRDDAVGDRAGDVLD